MKIAIEGMDGVGKTTIAKMIAKSENMLYIDKPLKEIFDTEIINGKDNLASISSNIYKLDDEILKAWFFGMGNLYTFIKYKDRDLIVDRHFASNYFWNGSDRSKNIFKNMIDLVGKPDLTILLYATIETRLKRIYERNSNDYDLADKEKHVIGYDKMIDFLDEFQIPYVLVNTENKSINDVYIEIKEIIRLLKNELHVKNKVKSRIK